MHIIEVHNLEKTFAKRQGRAIQTVEAVRGVSFEIKQGEIFGLLGPNGAGKTTTMRILSTLLTPGKGKALVGGHDLRTEADVIRKEIGYVSQVGGLERSNTGWENLMLQAGLYGLSREVAIYRGKELLKRFELESFALRQAKTYSGGQRRRFDIALGMIHKPKILFLDEPTTGLDPQSRIRVWEEVMRFRDEGITVFITTHYLDEADKLCDRIIIMDQGKIVKEGTPEGLKAEIAGDSVVLGFEDSGVVEKVLAAIKDIKEVRGARKKDETLQLYVDQGEEALPKLIEAMHKAGHAVKSAALSCPTLDDVFINLTGRSLRDENKES